MDRSSEISYAGVAGGVGGLLGLAGVYLGWFAYSYAVEGGTLEIVRDGTEDWTGRVAFIAGLGAFAFGIAHVLLSDPQMRRITGALMGVGAIFLLAMSILGSFRVDEALGVPFTPGVDPGTAVTVSFKAGGGLWASMVGGIVSVYGTYLAVRGTS